MQSRFRRPGKAAFYINGMNLGWNVLKAILLILVIVVLFIGDVVKKKEKEEAAMPSGNVCVEISLEKGDYDVDLWVKAPGDVQVGYSNLASRYFNLLRDDLGNPDPELNFEIACTRGIPAGEYVANIHWYASRGTAKDMPVHADVRVTPSLADSGKGSQKVILETDATLAFVGEELTLFRFTLTDKGALVPGSVNSLFTPLRSQGTGGGQSTFSN
ncbi:MAG: hypothetical protein Q7S95_01510 [bacterium]|nr:hypothetical protein [bacterium]